MKFDSKLTVEDHVRGIFSRVSQRIGILRLVKCIFVDTIVSLHCYFAFVLPILGHCSPVLGSAAECLLQHLEHQGYLVTRLCPDQSFLSLCHRRRMAGLNLINVCSASFHRLLLELNIPKLWPLDIHWSLKNQEVERPNLLGLSSRLRFDCGMTFPTLHLIRERWMGSRVQSTVGCFPELCFLQFSVVQVLVGLRKQFINNFVFPTLVYAAGFNNNN